MNRVHRQLLVLAALALTLASAARGAVQSGTGLNSGMDSIDRYLMAPGSEISLARSAAPAAISRNAAVLILRRQGYVTAVNGTNGFTCLVERAWMSPFDSPEFWNPKVRGPICYNPPASRTVLLYTYNRTALVFHRFSRAQMLERIDAAFAAKKLPPPEPGSMSYMMSKKGDLGDAVGAWRPHLIFHAPKAAGVREGISWGADWPGSPVVLNTSYRETPEPETIFMVPLGMWSDGSPAPPASQM